MQVKYIEDPITKVQSYKLKKYYGKDMNEKRCRNGKAIWNVTKGTEERFLEKCKEDEQQLGFFAFFAKDYTKKEEEFVQKIFLEEDINNYYGLFQCCIKIKVYLCLEGFLVFDCCDIGDEARLSLCFCKNKQENIQNILEGV